MRTSKIGEVLDALRIIKAPRISVLDVKALGDEVVTDERFGEQMRLSGELGAIYSKMVKIELICDDAFAERAKETILRTARTGYKGDGLVSISPIEEAISIRTGENAMEG